MDIDTLIAALSRPDAYPHAVDAVDVRQTHISAVFLAGPFAYKLKKPVNLGFLDFSTLSQRDFYCQEEVRLNRRLAPAVYLGVVPVTRANGRISIDRAGELVDWAVKMTRLPETATLEYRLRRGEVDLAQIENLAAVLARFHAMADRSDTIARFGRFHTVARNARENFAQAEPEIGRTVHPDVFARLRTANDALLNRLRPLIDARAGRGVPCDTHGDLHLDHVYLFPDRPPPDDWIAIDCIEFNDRFRFADPVADMAFLAMDLTFHGRRNLAAAFAAAYFRAAKDDEGRALLPFYAAYRAAVRGKVEGFELRDAEIPATEKETATVRAKAHWLLALGELSEPATRPCLVLVSGLPGTGKSTLAAGLAERADFDVIRSDVIRKELAGLSAPSPPGFAGGEGGEASRGSTPSPQPSPPQSRGRGGNAPGGLDAGNYSPAWTDRTYVECLRRTEVLLFAGKRVIVDAMFREQARRETFLAAARRWGVPFLNLECRADADVARRRLVERTGDASDATVEVYEAAARRWEPPGLETAATHRTIATDDGRDGAIAAAIAVLREYRLA